MKKIFLLFSISFLFLTSCSGDNESISEPGFTTNGSILKKINMSTTGFSYTAEYFYVGNKLQKIESTEVSAGTTINRREEYTYSGNLITQIAIYVNNVLTSTGSFNYDGNNRLVMSKSLSNVSSQGYKTTYTHNPDGTITVTGYSGDLVNQNTVTFNKKVFFTGNLVSSIEKYQTVSGVLQTTTISYGYDSKHDPFHAILGFDKLTLYGEGNFYGCPKNITTLSNTVDQPFSNSVTNIAYTYNSYDFPVTSTETRPSNPDLVREYFYQQP